MSDQGDKIERLGPWDTAVLGFLALPARGLVAIVLGDSAGGVVALRLLSDAILVSVVLGRSSLESQRSGPYGFPAEVL